MCVMKKLKGYVLIRQRLEDFLYNNSDIALAIDRIFNFGQKYLIIVYKTLEDYNDGYYTRKRLYLVSLARLMTLLTIIRFLSSTMISNKWIISVTSNANHLLANQRLLSIAISMGGF